MALTDKEIQALKPKEKKYKVFDRDGLTFLSIPSTESIGTSSITSAAAHKKSPSVPTRP